MELSPEQGSHLVEKGYVVLPGAIPKELVNNAVRAINTSIGQNGIDPARLMEFRAQSYCPELKREPVMLDIFEKSDLGPTVRYLLGEIHSVDFTQIALRFPSEGDRVVGKPHIDGMHSPHNGVPEGEIYSFSALAGVFLSDIDDEFAGNFTVWPGTHILNQNYFRERGPKSLLEGMPQVGLPEPVQIKAKSGDAVIAHYLLSHGVTPNRAINTRYALFFRMSHLQHENQKWETLTNAWLEWGSLNAS